MFKMTIEQGMLFAALMVASFIGAIIMVLIRRARKKTKARMPSRYIDEGYSADWGNESFTSSTIIQGTDIVKDDLRQTFKSLSPEQQAEVIKQMKEAGL